MATKAAAAATTLNGIEAAKAVADVQRGSSSGWPKFQAWWSRLRPGQRRFLLSAMLATAAATVILVASLQLAVTRGLIFR